MIDKGVLLGFFTTLRIVAEEGDCVHELFVSIQHTDKGIPLRFWMKKRCYLFCYTFQLFA